MNETPPPDIPDPASPTPATPAAAKPRRVITLPDSAKASRLPGTYAANYSSDPDWHRGVAVLWALFGLAAVGEFLLALSSVLSGQGGPGQGDVARISAEAVIFLLLWVGWSWTRWVLVTVDFLFGAWYVIRSIAPLPPQFIAAHPEMHVVQGLGTLTQLALGVIYLLSAGYLAFSSDVIGFARHRREEGRGWVVAPLAVVVAAYAVLVCNLQPLCQAWFERLRPDAGRFATESLRAMAEHWDVAAYEQRADADYLKVWPKDYRDPTFGTFAGLGPLQTLNDVQTSEGVPMSSPSGGGFLVKYHCDFGKIRCAHGTVLFACVVTRHMLGAWRLQNIEASQLEQDPEPAATPPAPAIPPAPL